MGNKRNKNKNVPTQSYESIENIKADLIAAFNEKIDQLNFSDLTTGTSSTRHELANTINVAEKPKTNKDEIELLRQENQQMRQLIQDKDVQNFGFTFKDVEESLNKFSGDDNFKVGTWVREFEEMAETIGWNSIQKLVYAKRLLIGTARQSVNARSGLKTWEELQQYLKQEFHTCVNSAQVHRMLVERKKKSTESFFGYLLSMQEIAEMGGVEEAALLDYVIDGIGDAEMNKAVLYGAQTMEEFKKKLRIYENIKRKSTATIRIIQNQPERRDKTESKKYRGTRCYTCGDSGHIGRNCTNKEKGPKCYKCNNFGHIATQCKKDKVQEEKVLSVVSSSGRNNVKKIIISGQEYFAMVDSGSDRT